MVCVVATTMLNCIRSSRLIGAPCSLGVAMWAHCKLTKEEVLYVEKGDRSTPKDGVECSHNPLLT
jgi:hypothetical protein